MQMIIMSRVQNTHTLMKMVRIEIQMSMLDCVSKHVEDEAPFQNRNIPKASKGLNHAKADDKECERVVAKYVQCKVKWKNLYAKN